MNSFFLTVINLSMNYLIIIDHYDLIILIMFI